MVIFVDGQLEKGKDHVVKVRDLLAGTSLEEVPVFAEILVGSVLEGS